MSHTWDVCHVSYGCPGLWSPPALVPPTHHLLILPKHLGDHVLHPLKHEPPHPNKGWRLRSSFHSSKESPPVLQGQAQILGKPARPPPLTAVSLVNRVTGLITSISNSPSPSLLKPPSLDFASTPLCRNGSGQGDEDKAKRQRSVSASPARA